MMMLGGKLANPLEDEAEMPVKNKTRAPLTPAAQLAAFLAKYEPSIARQARAWRTAMRRHLPTALELIYDNYQFLAIGYCSTERASDCIASLAVSPKGVALSFYRGSTLPDPGRRLLGSGKQNRFIRLVGAATLAEPEVAALLRAAVAQARTPLPTSGRGRTVIKSVSAKQRPRRAPSR